MLTAVKQCVISVILAWLANHWLLIQTSLLCSFYASHARQPPWGDSTATDKCNESFIQNHSSSRGVCFYCTSGAQKHYLEEMAFKQQQLFLLMLPSAFHRGDATLTRYCPDESSMTPVTYWIRRMLLHSINGGDVLFGSACESLFLRVHVLYPSLKSVPDSQNPQ